MDTVKVTGDQFELFLQFWTPLVIRFHLMCNMGYFEKISRFWKKLKELFVVFFSKLFSLVPTSRSSLTLAPPRPMMQPIWLWWTKRRASESPTRPDRSPRVFDTWASNPFWNYANFQVKYYQILVIKGRNLSVLKEIYLFERRQNILNDIQHGVKITLNSKDPKQKESKWNQPIIGAQTWNLFTATMQKKCFLKKENQIESNQSKIMKINVYSKSNPTKHTQ